MSISQKIDLGINIDFHCQKRKSATLGVARLLFLFGQLVFLLLLFFAYVEPIQVLGVFCFCTGKRLLELSRTGMYATYPYLESHKSREPVPS
jgi:hypothetical protein